MHRSRMNSLFLNIDNYNGRYEGLKILFENISYTYCIENKNWNIYNN